MPHVVRVALSAILTYACNLSVGVVINMRAGLRSSFGQVRVMLQYGRAHAGITHAKGAIGNLIRALCQNCCNFRLSRPCVIDVPFT